MIVYQLKVTLKRSQPPIWRRIQVSPKITFHQLHQIIQIAMDWSDTHLHEFSCKIPESKRQRIQASISSENQNLFGYPWSEEMAKIGNIDQNEGFFSNHYLFDEQKEIVGDWLTKEKDNCLYTYDFGDDWQHEILLEKILPAEPGVEYPKCVKARREAPEEDSGGFWNLAQDENGRTDLEIAEEINKAFRKEADRLRPAEPSMRTNVEKSDPSVNVPNEPTIEEWKKLYDAAIRFKELKCWEWMGDRDLFAVQDTRTGYTGYCGVMGQAGELFGLAVYVGDEGLKTLLKIIDDNIYEDDLLEQRALLLTFENRENLNRKDLELIKSLGLRFRGRNQWPVFRSYAPGLYPWYLNREEVLFFTQVLEQALDVCRRAKENPNLLKSKDDQHIFARRSFVQGNRVDWEDTWLKLSPNFHNEKEMILIESDLELNRLKKKYKKVPIVVEFDMFYMPHPVQEQRGERPYYPYAGFFLEQQNGLILGFELLHRNDHLERFQKVFLNIVEQVGWIPKTVLVQRKKAYSLLSPIAQKLGINLQMVPELPVLPEVLQEVIERFGSHFL